MLKILSGQEVKSLDSAHIYKNGISSTELMERAAVGFVDWWKGENFDKSLPISIFCGAGNNGGDGFAIARLLQKLGVKVLIFKCFEDSKKLSPDAQKNFERIPKDIEVKHWREFESVSEGVAIDAFLGVGLTGELRTEAQQIIQKINSHLGNVISVDMPSGLPSDGVLTGICVKADYTATFAFPKLSLLFPEHGQFTGKLILIDIGIDDKEYNDFESSFFYLQKKDITAYHKKFHRFSHKGDFGKVLMIAGSAGKMGAAVLTCQAALRSGSGLVTAFVPASERHILQIAVPEAMCLFELPADLPGFDSIGIGPGMGLEGNDTILELLFKKYPKPMVIDADALTILSNHPHLIPMIPKGSIFTPHVIEFDRLLGKTSDHKQRLEKASDFCKKWGVNLLIKGANSAICLADGRYVFNSSGTQYMATGGSGDVLTGMITSLLGQGYSPENALICGVFHHGLAGEIAGINYRRGTIASDIIKAIPLTFIELNIS